jgi:N-acetylneuraminate synthase
MNSKEYILANRHNNSFIPKPFVIAEAGVNHEGSMETAKLHIEQAAEAGADAIKFQSYKAKTLASKNSPSYWDTTKEPTTSQFKLFQRHDSFWKNEFEALKVHCDEVGIEFMSTPFDLESSNFLNDLMISYKISSSDITNLPFIKHIAAFNKPVILSTGASYMHEIFEAVNIIEENKNPLCIMHCVLNYPTPSNLANLGMITDLKKRFPEHLIGYSDHTLPEDIKNLEIAVLLGAWMLEKHFTHDKTLQGNDHYHAMDKDDLATFIKMMEKTQIVMGDFDKKPLETEAISRQNARRSLVAQSNIKEGEIISEKHLTWKRPAFGVSPKDLDQIIGKQAKRNIEEDEIIYWDMINMQA